MIVTSRDFRANQSKYIGYAHSGEDVILKSRAGSVRLTPVDTTEVNRAYIERGEVKVDIKTDVMELEELRGLLHKVVDLEYSLP